MTNHNQPTNADCLWWVFMDGRFVIARDVATAAMWADTWPGEVRLVDRGKSANAAGGLALARSGGQGLVAGGRKDGTGEAQGGVSGADNPVPRLRLTEW